MKKGRISQEGGGRGRGRKEEDRRKKEEGGGRGRKYYFLCSFYRDRSPTADTKICIKVGATGICVS
jgi:hypothetical protein